MSHLGVNDTFRELQLGENLDWIIVKTVLAIYGWEEDTTVEKFLLNHPCVAAALANGRDIITMLFGQDVEVSIEIEDHGAIMWIHSEIPEGASDSLRQQFDDQWAVDTYWNTNHLLNAGVI